MQTYRLGSAPFLHAPGIISWAINGYAFKEDRDIFLKVITEGWDIPEDAAKSLLSGQSPLTLEGDVVVFKA